MISICSDFDVGLQWQESLESPNQTVTHLHQKVLEMSNASLITYEFICADDYPHMN